MARARSTSRSPSPESSRRRERRRSDDREHKSRHRSRSPAPRDRSEKDHRSSGHRGRSPDSRSSSSRHHRRDRSRSPDADRRSRKHDRRSRSQTPASSGSDSERNRDGRSSRKDKHRERKSKRKSRSRSRERRDKKKSKKDKKKHKSASKGEWGQYGIISDADMYKMDDEFRTWLVEEKMVNRETLSKDAERKLFASFVEDFNTATLPHEKYYNMAKYEIRMSALRSGETLPSSSTYDPNADLNAHSASHKRTVVEQDTYLSKEQLGALRKVQMERVEAGKMKALGMDIKSNLGVRMDGNQFEPGRR